MTSQHDKAKRWWQFRLSTFLLTLALICTSLAWWRDRSSLKREIARQEVLVTVRGGLFVDRLAVVGELAQQAKKIEDGELLLFALSDMDFRVVMAARDGLRKLSNKPKGFGFPDNVRWSVADLDSLIALRRWEEWYITARRQSAPDYALPDFVAVQFESLPTIQVLESWRP